MLKDLTIPFILSSLVLIILFYVLSRLLSKKEKEMASSFTNKIHKNNYNAVTMAYTQE